MSITSKKARKQRREDDMLGGPFPSISVGATEIDSGIYWRYHVAPTELCLVFPFEAQDDPSPYIVIDGESVNVSDDDGLEERYGAITRLRLLQEYAAEIADPCTSIIGLTRLREAATAAGLYGRREPRQCIVPHWTTV